MEAFTTATPDDVLTEQIIASGVMESCQRVEAALCFPLPKFSDIRTTTRLPVAR